MSLFEKICLSLITIAICTFVGFWSWGKYWEIQRKWKPYRGIPKTSSLDDSDGNGIIWEEDGNGIIWEED